MKIDTITWPEHSEPAVNLSQPVGIGAPNQWGDVLLIQVLLKFVYNKRNPIEASFIWGANLDYKPQGHMDDLTKQAITNFQLFNRNKLYTTAIDGRIDVAHYQNRTINQNKPLMTITLLHVMASDTAWKRGKWFRDDNIPAYWYELVNISQAMSVAKLEHTPWPSFSRH